MTDGQRSAIEQLGEVEAASEGFIRIIDAADSPIADWQQVTLSVRCSEMERAQSGLPLRPRERLIVHIPPDFPFEKPVVITSHTRFADFPHVLWKHEFCLYQSPATEWNPADGMFGFIDRLNDWLKRGALGEWGVVGEPIHPPVTYLGSGDTHIVVPRANTPEVTTNWCGTSQLRAVSERRVDIEGWSPLFDTNTPPNAAAAILLAEPISFEFPATVNDLLIELIARGIGVRDFLVTLQAAVIRNKDEDPLYVIVGTPMRGIHGSGRPKQHIVAWYVSPRIAKLLRMSIGRYHDNQTAQVVGQLAEELILEWAKTAEVEWCWVLEARDEIITRRDHQSAMNWFAGKTIALWGCGALGGYVAEHLTRAGARKLILRDKGAVKPGLLVRQPYDDADLGRSKAFALARHIKRIRDIDVDIHVENILSSALDSADWTDGADLLIDTTASEIVLAKLELRRHTINPSQIPIVSMAVGHLAQHSMTVVSGAQFSGGPFDVDRRTKLATCNRLDLSAVRDDFWPDPDSPRRAIFQPEPGCSEDTYVGSSADLGALSATMLNLAASDLAAMAATEATAHLFTQPHVSRPVCEPIDAKFSWSTDIICNDPQSGYEVRIAQAAWSEILGWIKQSSRNRGSEVEAGGLLFGERNDAVKVIWVSEVIGPPPDSRASAEEFVCGVEGTREANNEKRSRTRGSVQYVGLWHSHPGSSPIFSSTDLEGMRQVTEDEEASPSKTLMLIVGTPETVPTIGAYVFGRSDFSNLKKGLTVRVAEISVPNRMQTSHRVGLALSGGGSRAIAFHLGCLRALHDRGVLPHVQVVSSVSGGSVIAAMYAYSDDSFEDFEKRVISLLRRGLVPSILREVVFSPIGLGSIATNLVAGGASLACDALRAVITLPSAFIGSAALAGFARRIRSPFSRWITITTAFEKALARRLFEGMKLSDASRDNIQIVFNACELRTGSAFRFGNEKSGCWRFGLLATNDVPVALAVATSAAYPVILPAVDRSFEFVDRKGNRSRNRVILTDGGVFENLGVSCLEPGRSADFSQQTFDLDYIVCCDAGQGLLGDNNFPFYWPGRMKRSFESIYRKANDAVRARLFNHVEAGKLRGFCLAYLGQMDSALPYIPPDLVRREQVKDYPTDFSAMSQSDISLLSRRGEQLTRVLISRYCEDL